jgi:hypothetical protein
MGWGSIASGIGGFFAADKAQDAAEESALMVQKMNREQERRLSENQAIDRSALDVLQYSGGFSGDSVSNQIYRRQFERLQKDELDWLKLVGQSRYDAAQAEVDMYGMQKLGSALTVLGGAAGLG